MNFDADQISNIGNMDYVFNKVKFLRKCDFSQIINEWNWTLLMNWSLTEENLSTKRKPVSVQLLHHTSQLDSPESQPAPLREKSCE
jgi:hypothetical protein